MKRAPTTLYLFTPVSTTDTRFMRDHNHHLFFAPQPGGDTIMLAAHEAHHAVSVLRARAGDTVSVTDGNGHIYTCVIEKLDKTACAARIVATTTATYPHAHLRLFVGLPDRDAFEAVLEGAVPLGVSSVTPVACRHCQIQWWKGKWEKLETRFRRIAVESAKQSRSPFLPALEGVVLFDTALQRASGAIVYADNNGAVVADIAPQLSGSATVSCFVGPPGGFAQEELEALGAKGAHAVWLAANRLRTEIAALALTAAVLQTVKHNP